MKTQNVVLTSGNISKEPIIRDNEEAFKKLGCYTDLLISHNRAIHNRVDDSVVQCCGENIQILRRSRGYAPEPLEMDFSVDGMLAFGAEQTSAFAMGKRNQVIISQYIGDIKERKNYLFFKETLQNFKSLFRFTPRYLVCDLHSQYNSSILAQEISREMGLPLVRIQHHHAHAVSVMAENHLQGNTLAVCLDGTGYGTDGHSWGGEFLECNYENFIRLDHWDYVPLPGGDKAASEPWRMAVAYLHQNGYSDIEYPDSFYRRIGKQKIETIEKMIDRHINTPLTCGTGRIFDAVASLIGLCDLNTYQAQASISLEHAARRGYEGSYEYDVHNPLSLHGIFRGIVSDLENKTETGVIASRFHKSLAAQIVCCVRILLQKQSLNNVVLSGGVFQNKLLTQYIVNQLTADGIPVFMSRKVPCNDENIALGQLGAAAHLFKLNKK